MEMMCYSDNLKAFLSMMLVQLFVTGMLLLSKVVLDQGMFVFALLAYRHVVGAVCVAPFALFSERGTWRNLSWKAIFWIFINALSGITLAMALYLYGLRDTTAGFSSNFLNLIPIVTFFFAVIVGVEKLGLGSRGGRVKVMGTLLSVGGAMVVSLYKGKALHIWPSHSIMHHNSKKEAIGVHHWLRGTLLLLGSCTSYACWFIVQVKLNTVFSSKYWTTTLTCLAACLQTLAVGIIINREMDSWRLKWNLQLLTIVFMGVFNTGATFCLVSWVIAKKGPVYPSMFNPLSVIFTIILESLFMGQDITIGSLIGTFIIIGGLYAFLWAKGKELVVQGRSKQASNVSESEENIVHGDVSLVDTVARHETTSVDTVPRRETTSVNEDVSLVDIVPRRESTTVNEDSS